MDLLATKTKQLFLCVSVTLYLVLVFANNQIILNSSDFEYNLIKSTKKNSSSNIIVLTQVITIVLGFLAICNVQVAISYVYTEVMHSTLCEYFKLKVSAIQRISANKIQSLIQRRATAFCSLLECLVMRIIPRVLFLVCSLKSLTAGQGFKTHALLLSILFIVVILQVMRSFLSIRVNHLYEVSNAKRIEIIENYEAIVSYKLLDLELLEYNSLLEDCIFLKQVYTCSYHLIFLFLGISLTFFFSSIWKSSVDKVGLVALIMLNEKFKDYLYRFLKDLDCLIKDYIVYSYSGYSKIDTESLESAIEPIEFKEHISVESLEIRARNRLILSDMNFLIKKNEKVAIVGSNGSGKSLLIEALTGNAGGEGCVKLDGVDVCKISRKALNSLITYVPQHTTVLNTTIKRNLSIGMHCLENEELVEICKKFDCHSLFTRLGYEKPIGASGKLLSGGQRQRIILLRSIMRRSKILVLDGAFLGVDQKTEEQFVKTLTKEQQTLIFSTQNPNILGYFDEIIFINNGTAVKGSLNELIANSLEFKAFYGMKTTQMDLYRTTVPIETPKMCA